MYLLRQVISRSLTSTGKWEDPDPQSTPDIFGYFKPHWHYLVTLQEVYK